MSLFRKADTAFWWYDFTYAGTRYRKSTHEKNKSAAAKKEAADLHRLSQGLELPRKDAKTPTLREFTVRFLAWAENSIALDPDTRKYYLYGVRLLLWTRMADVPLDRLTGEVIECSPITRRVINRRTRLETGEVVSCSATYTNQALSTLSVLLGKAVEWEVLRTRPRFAKAKTQGRDRLIDHDTEIRLQDQFQASTKLGHRNGMRTRAWLVMVILQDTGMRPDEVFPLRIENVRFAENRIWIPEGKTSNARRFVGMSDRMRGLLLTWCKGREGWVFPSRRSASGHLESIHKSFQSARQRAGLDTAVVPYSARHTYGTHQMEAIGNIFAVSRSMGHAGVKSMGPYQHPDTAQLNVAINERNRARDLHRLTTEARHSLRHSPELIM